MRIRRGTGKDRSLKRNITNQSNNKKIRVRKRKNKTIGRMKKKGDFKTNTTEKSKQRKI